MTAKRKSELARKFTDWLETRNCSVKCFKKKTGRSVNSVCEVVELDAGGNALNTLCYETFPGDMPAGRCWTELLSRRCDGKLLFDEFHTLGLGSASTLEELELKLEICIAAV